MREAIVAWSGRGDAFPEYVAALPWVALAVLGLAWWRAGWRLTGIRLPLTLLWVSLALGPFVRIAGLEHAHSDAVGVAPLCCRSSAWSARRPASRRRHPDRRRCSSPWRSSHLCRRYPARRRAILAAVALLLALRALAGAAAALLRRRSRPLRDRPRRSAPGPARPRAALRRPRRRVVDGQLQRALAVPPDLHGKALVGGYLSRVSSRRKRSSAAAGAERADDAQRAQAAPSDRRRQPRAAAADRFLGAVAPRLRGHRPHAGFGQELVRFADRPAGPDAGRERRDAQALRPAPGALGGARPRRRRHPAGRPSAPARHARDHRRSAPASRRCWERPAARS